MKKSFVKILRGGVYVAASALLIAVAVSCNVGLGESVDTEAPKLEITYPPVSAAIRDSFILSGTCSDDKEVTSVKVTMMNTATNETVLSEVSAQVNSDTWRIKLNSYDTSNSSYCNGWQFSDGTYQVNVTAYDNAGHSSGTASRTFDIDNTPPVFIISNPGVVKNGTTSPSAYGSIFTVEGTIADDHTIGSMDVIIYNESGEVVSNETYNDAQISSFHEDNIPTAGGTSVIIAQYGSKRYETLHSAAEGTEYYTASIKLTDSAKIYQNPTEESNSTTGNETYSLYLYDDVYTKLMSAKKGLGLSAADIKNILNGTYTADASKKSSAEELLLQKTINTEVKSDADNLYFSLNPQANPTYQVNGFAYDFADGGTIQTASSGNTLSITLSAGLDGTNIDLDGNDDTDATVKVWMKEYDSKPSASGTYTQTKVLSDISALAAEVTKLENAEASFVQYKDAALENAVTETGGFKLIYDYAQNTSGNESSVATKTFSVTIPEGSVSLGKYYIIAVTGSDVEDVVFLQDKVYGFEGNEAGVAPAVVIVSPEGASLQKSSDFAFSGTASLSSGSLYVTELKATLTVTDQNTNSTIGTYTEDISRTSADAVLSGSDALVCADGKNWTFTPSLLSGYAGIQAAEGSKKSYIYTLEIYGKSSSGHDTTVSSYVQIDSVPPIVEIASISPTVDGGEYDSSENTYVNGTVTVKGNIEETNLEKVTMQVFVGGEAASCFADSNGNTADILDLGKVYSFTQAIDTALLTDAKSLDIRVTATDKVGNSATYSSLTSTGTSYGKLEILQETDRPKILLGNSSNSSSFTSDSSNISETNGNLFGTTSNNQLTATISDDDNIALVKVTVYDESGNLLDGSKIYTAYNGANPYALSPNKSTASLTYYLPPDEGVYQICIDAYDYLETETYTKSTGKGSTGKYFIAVSAGAPSVTVDSYSNYQTASPAFSGKVSTFATEITASFVGADSSDATTYQKTLADQPTTFTAAKTDGTWSGAIAENASKLSDGEYSILFTAENKYGQTSSTTVIFTVDTKAPTVTPVKGSAVVGLDDSRYVTLAATVNDSSNSGFTSGLAAAYYFVSLSEKTWQTTDANAGNYVSSSTLSSSWTTLSQGKENWNATLYLDETSYNYDATVYVYFAAVDQAGNIGVSSGYEKLTLDKTQPSVVLYQDESCTTEISSSSANPWARNSTQVSDGKITFYAKVTDSNVDSKDGLTASNVDITIAENTPATDGCKIYTVTMPVDTTGTTASAEFKGHDANGRESATASVYVKCDIVAPVIASVAAEATTKDSETYINQANSAKVSAVVTENNISTVTVYLLTDSSDTDKTKAPDSSSKNAAAVQGEATSSSTDTSKQYNYSSTVTGVDDGTYYVAVVAEDTFGNKTIAKKQLTYVVDVTSPEVGALTVKSGGSEISSVNIASKGSDITISATAKDATSGISSVALYDGTTKLGDDVVSTSSTTATDGTLTYTFTISSGNVEKVFTTGTHTLSVRVADKAGNTGTAESKTISSDVTAPTVSITDATPEVEENNETYVNGKITVSGTAQDETALDGNNLTIKIYKSGDTNQTDLSSTGGLIAESSTESYTLSGASKNWKFVLDTTKLTDNSSYVIEVSANDVAGNSSTVATKTINVKQSTDAPGIEITSVDDASIEKIADLVGKQKNILAPGGKITATITDDDGIASATVSYQAENASDKSVWTTSDNLISTSGRTTANISFVLPSGLAEGGYLFKIDVTDTKKETSYYTKETTAAVAVDSGAPEITLSNTNGNFYNATIPVSGSVSDASGKVALQASYGSDGTNHATGTYSTAADVVSTSSTTTTTSATLSDTITVSALSDNTSTGYTATYTATDRWGQSKTASLNYYVDKTKPELSSSADTLGNLTGYDTIISSWFKDEALKAGGQITESGSGIEAVYYWLNPDPSANASCTDVSTATGSFGAKSVTGQTYNYTYSSTIGGFATGTNTLTLVALDNAGNKSNELTYTVKIDSTDPEIVEDATRITVNGTESSSSTLLVNGNYDVIVSGQVTDADSKINPDRVYVSVKTKITATGTSLDAIGSAEATKWQKATVTQSSNDSNVYDFTATVPQAQLTEANSGTIYLLITDNAGNRVNNVSLASMTVDKTAPEVSLNYPSDAATSTTEIEVNGNITFSGTASDTNELSKISRIEYSTDNKNWTPLSDVTFTGTTSWTSSKIDTTIFTDETTYYFRAVAVDAAQNEGTSPEITVKVSQDTDRPVVKISNLTASTDSSGNYVSPFILKYGTNAQVTGTITDDDATSSAVVRTLVISESAYTGSESDVANLATLNNSATGDFTFQPADTGDGKKTFYIYIEDNAGNKFYTTATAENYLKNPKVYLKTTDLGNEVAASEFIYKSDSNSPSVSNAQSYTYATGSDNKNTTTDSEGNTVENLESVGASFIAGGTEKSKLQFVITANDANGIAGMSFEIKTGENTVAQYATSTTIGSITLNGYTASTTSFAPKSDSTDAVWTTGIIDISNTETYASGTYTLRVTAYDNSGLYGTGTYSFVIDNDKPAVSISSPSSSEEVTGDTTVQGTSIDAGGSATETTYWFVPTQEQITTAKSKDDKQSYWHDLIVTAASDPANTRSGSTVDDKSTVSVWAFTFGTSGSAKNSNLTAFDDINFNDSSNTSIYNIPLYIMAEDSLGNYFVKTDYTVKHNPDGDKPVTTITYPDESPITLGGTIRTSGTVTIPSGNGVSANALFIQIDSSENFTSTYVTGDTMVDSSRNGIYTVYSAAEAIKEVLGDSVSSVDFKTLTYDQLKSYGFTPASDSTDDVSAKQTEFNNWWGIKANKGSSSLWTRNINSNGEFDPTDSGTTNTIYLRACGINSNGKIGAWTNTYTVNVDNTAPTIGYALNQFSAISQTGSELGALSVSKSQTASKSYTPNMYLKGNWYIAATVLDESGISELTVSESGTSSSSYNIITTSTTSGTSTQTLTIPDNYFIESATGASTTKKGYTIYIPVSISNGDTVTYTVQVTDSDGTAHTSKMEFVLNIDNTPPTIDYVYGNGNATKDATTSSRFNVQESNYVFTPSGRVTDDGSGYERVLFQFVRTSNDILENGTKVVLDPMIVTSGSDYTEAKVAIDGTTVAAQTVKQDDITSYSLYGKNVSGTLSSTSTFTATTSADISDDKHIRAYGVVYIDGVYRVIQSISGGVVTFDPALPNEPDTTTTVDAFFPYVQVVDHTSTEKLTSTTYKDNPLELSGDDGDGMLESISKAGTTWTWDATIHSTNLPDGPATLIVLAFDAAGNVSGKEIPVMIANNAPRLAKLWLATDLDSNGSFESNEFVTYELLESSEAKEGVEAAAKDLENKFTAKNRLALAAEFTGGNGAINMTFLRNSSSTDAVKLSDSSSTSLIAPDATATADSSSATLTSLNGSNLSSLGLSTFFSSSTVNAYVLSNENLTGSDTDSEDKDGKDKNFSFTFWDSTEETICGTDSQNARLALTNMTLDLVDGTPPTVVVNPFYWASSSNNSLYENSRSNGHIELEGDLTDTIKTDYGDDPKVSGKIVFTGTAFDEHALGSISFVLGSYKRGTIATYDKTTKVWTAGTGTLSDDGWQASITYVNGNSTSAGNYYDDTTYFDQIGHKVYWTLTVDTEKISDIAAKDVVLTVTATDLAGNISDKSTPNAASTDNGYVVTDGTTHVPIYKMDVVPYIAGIKTSLSTLKKGNSSVFDRTALGHYPVASTETIYVYGFNLSGGTLYDSATSAEHASLTSATASEQGWYSSSAVPAGSVYSVESISRFTSGNVYAAVNKISSLNNINSNDSKGDFTTEETIGTTGSATVYANYYNRQPNGDSNNLLTDDVVLDVWEFRTAAKPVSGKIEQPVMKINPAGDNEIGFAFTSGPLYFSMPGGVDSVNAQNSYNTSYKTKLSYSYWIASYDFFTSVGLTYDKLGHTYAVAAGGDINSNQADHWDLMSSRWGIGGKNSGGSYDGANIRVLESIGLVSDGTYLFDKQRIKSPSLVTTSAETDSTKLYLAYYDAMNGQIRFRSGKIFNTDSSSTDGFKEASRSRSNPSDSIGSQYRSLIAGGSGNASKPAGEYVSIGAIENGGESDDLVMAVWYDQTNRCLWYNYTKTPNSNRGKTDGSGWNTPVQVFTGNIENAGEYCQLVVDGKKGVHIAAYDPVNCDLVYAYLPDSKAGVASASSDFSTCVVDANGVIGSNVTIDVSLDKTGGTPTPRIGYYGTSCIRPKYAYSVGSISSTAEAGALDDAFTQKWECSVVPTLSSVNMQSNQYNKMNVGVWKDTSGVANSPKKTEKNSQKNIGSGYDAFSYGYAYSNSTGNPVLGYVIKVDATSDEIQTAQMQ